MKERSLIIARQFRKKYISGTPTAEQLKSALQRQGYTIVPFRSAYNEGPAAVIIESLKLEEYIRSTKGFTCAGSDYRMVFLHEDLSEQEQLLVLLHEQGHILHGHMTGNAIVGQDILQEYEANEFAHYVLHPSGLDQAASFFSHYKKIFLIAGAAILAVAIGIGTWFAVAQSSKNETYYITSTGFKYHTEDCIYIKNKDNVTQLPLSELDSGNYTPCDVCHPHR